MNWGGGYCALLPLPFYHHFYKYLLSPFGPLASKSKSAIASNAMCRVLAGNTELLCIL